MRTLYSLLLGIVGIYTCIVLLMFLLQERLVHVPHIPGRELNTTPSDVELEYESVFFTTADGVKLHGWFLPAREPRMTLLFFHGNAGNISHRLASLVIFNRLNFDVLIFDYRGYGRSEGSPSEPGLYQDAMAALHYLQQQRGVALRDMVFFGRSLGGAVASWLAVRQPPRALIIEASFTSIPDLAAELYPLLPVRRLARLQYSTRDNLASICSPVLIIHSTGDEVVPFQHGQRLFAAAREPKRFLEIYGDHNSGFLTSGEIYLDAIDDFRDFAQSLPYVNRCSED